MAITYTRQQATATAAAGGTSIAANTTADLVPGAVIVCWVGAGGAVTLTSMSAVTGITWIAGSGSTGAAATVITTNFNAASNAMVGLAVGVVTSTVTSGTTITANYSASDTRRALVIDEFAGVDTTTPVQTGTAANVASGAAGSDAAPSITTTGGPGLALVSANVMNSATVTMTPPSSPATFTETSDIPFTSKNITTAYLLGATAGTYSPTHTVTTGTRAAAEGGAAALNPAAAILATPFDELSARVLSPGPAPAGPLMFYEPLAELIFLSAAGTNWTATPGDSVTMSDALAFDQAHVLADSVTMSDAVAFQFSVTVADSVTMSDAVSFDRQLVIGDSVTMSDGIAAERGINQSVADSVTMSDLDTEATGKGVSPADSVTMSDAQTFDRAIVLTDTVTMTDSLAFQRTVTIGDSVTMSDAQAFQRSVTVADTIAMSDSLAFQRSVTVTDSVTMSDFADPVKTSVGGAAPPVTVRTFLVGSSGLTRARSPLSATEATGGSGILGVTGSDGATHATGTSGQTGAG